MSKARPNDGQNLRNTQMKKTILLLTALASLAFFVTAKHESREGYMIFYQDLPGGMHCGFAIGNLQNTGNSKPVPNSGFLTVYYGKK